MAIEYASIAVKIWFEYVTTDSLADCLALLIMTQVLSCLMKNLLEDEVLLSQLGQMLLTFLPFLLPVVQSECLILRVEQALSVSHLCHLLNGFFLDPGLFTLSYLLSHCLCIGLLKKTIDIHTLLHLQSLQLLDPLLLPLHHGKQLLKVHILKHLELPGLTLQLIQPL